MNNDSISREWLEDAFDNLCCHNCKICRNFRIEDSFYKCALIDNAPPVEVPEDKVNCVLTLFGKCSYNETGCSDCEIKDKIHKALNDRPTGEWLEDSGNIACSHCHTIWLYRRTDFCPHCGADMREEESE